MILAMDPGISARNATGLALLGSTSRRLRDATIIRRNPDLDDLDAMFDIAERAQHWAGAQGFGMTGDVFVSEWPQVYPHERNKDPNTALLPLCGVIGSLSGMLNRSVRRAVYLPRAWKGTISGDAFTERILERLEPEERALIEAIKPAGLRHNATDAAGLGLFHVGRMGRSRAVHNEAPV